MDFANLIKYLFFYGASCRTYLLKYFSASWNLFFTNFLLVPLGPVAFFPLNGQYETTDISHNHNPPGEVSNVELAPGPGGNIGGSYQFWGNLTSFIKFPNLGGLDTRYSMTLLAWLYHEQTRGPIFNYFSPGYYGVRFMVSEQGYFFVELRTSENTTLKSLVGSVVQEKTWHFVGSSYNYVNGEFTIWLDGSVDNRAVVDTPVELATQESAFMGAASNSHFKRRISCLQLYDRVLSEFEIQDAKQLCSATGGKIVRYLSHLCGFSSSLCILTSA